MTASSRSTPALIAAALLVALPLLWNAYETRQLRLATDRLAAAKAPSAPSPAPAAPAPAPRPAPKIVTNVVAYDLFHKLWKPVAPRAEAQCYRPQEQKAPKTALEEITHYRLQVGPDGRIVKVDPELHPHMDPVNQALRRCIAGLIQAHVRWPAPGKTISGRVQANRRY